METNHPSPAYQAGFSDGLAAAKSVTPMADLQVLSLANALDALAQHAARMDNADELTHEGCLECQTNILLARVVKFGDQLRDAERDARS